MRSYHIRTTSGIPVVSSAVVSTLGSLRVEFIFDSGSALTQIHIGTLEN